VVPRPAPTLRQMRGGGEAAAIMSNTGQEGDNAAVAASSRALVTQHVFQAAVDKTRVAMTLADPNLPDCPLVYVNPAFTNLAGYEPHEVVGRNCRFLQGPQTDREAVRLIREAVAGGQSVTQELYNYRKDGTGFWNALFISPVYDESRKLIYFFASQIDISASREAQRRQATRVESMGALASGVAHEFNNLMTVVLASIERATAQATQGSQKRHLDRAGVGAKRAGELASSLLSMAGRQAGDDRTVDLNQLVHDFEHALVQVAVEVAVVFDLAPMPIRVRVDPDQLELVLLSLVRNAADAMLNEGGQVIISTRLLSTSEAVLALDGQEAVELAVTDNGRGMPPVIAERATELFFTTKETGKGTGLFRALEFADKSGGRLSIDSLEGQGTRVRIVFPRMK
jgi:PAS domain S-box-containing protein